MASSLSNSEVSKYDRQIRLWGAESQQRIRESKVLIVGFCGIAAEVVKNLVLAGANIVVADIKTVQEQDLGCNFFFAQDDIGKNRASAGIKKVSELNELTNVQEIAFKEWSELAEKISGGSGVPVMVCNTHGFSGSFFFDGGSNYEFLEEKSQELGSEGKKEVVSNARSIVYKSFRDILASTLNTRPVKASESYAFSLYLLLRAFANGVVSGQDLADVASKDRVHSFAKALTESEGIPGKYDESVLDTIIQSWHVEFPPTLAVIGGLAAAESLKVITRKEAPIDCLLVFDGISGAGATILKL